MTDVQWLRPAQMHLTLAFLGSIGTDPQTLFQDALATIHVGAFFVPIRGVGTFPAKGDPRVIWAGLGPGHPHLFQLHKRVTEAVIAAGLEPDLRPWHPHITLGRCTNVSRGAIQPFLRRLEDFDAGMMRVEEFALYSSRPASEGSVYTKEETFDLH